MLEPVIINRLVLATAPLAIWAGALLAVLLLGVVASPPVEWRRRLDTLLHWTMACRMPDLVRCGDDADRGTHRLAGCLTPAAISIRGVGGRTGGRSAYSAAAIAGSTTPTSFAGITPASGR